MSDEQDKERFQQLANQLDPVEIRKLAKTLFDLKAVTGEDPLLVGAALGYATQFWHVCTVVSEEGTELDDETIEFAKSLDVAVQIGQSLGAMVARERIQRIRDALTEPGEN